MSVHEVTMYAAACDRCGRQAEYGGEYVAWAEPEGAIAQATDSYEMVELDNGRLLCDEPEPCWEWSEDEVEQVEKPAPDTSSASDTRPATERER